MAGGQHHHRINMDRYHPGYFGKVGMRYFHKTMNQYHSSAVNVDKLWSYVPEQLRLAAQKNPKGAVPVLNTLKLGYTKVLGNGSLPSIPIIVKARFVSRRAEEKIVAAGGKIELIA
jgi:large subunit ribosomal protein L27Ae